MEVKIFDIDHGFCALITDDDSVCTLIDCGQSERKFKLSRYLLRENLRYIVISNIHENRLNGFPDLIKYKSLCIKNIISNPSITPQNITQLLKKNDCGHGMYTYKLMLDYPKRTPKIVFPNFSHYADLFNLSPGFLKYYCNTYPDFSDMNNLSLVTFLDYHDIHIVFPGNLKKKGWLRLLENESFRKDLQKVTIYVTSGAGGDGVLCTEVFEHCKPKIIIIPGKVSADLKKITRYKPFASGLRFEFEERRVIATGKYGDIRIVQKPNTTATIGTKEHYAILS